MFKLVTLACAPVCLFTLTGCWTPPARLASAEGNPSLTGSCQAVEGDQYTATAESVDANQRKVVLARDDGTRAACKVAPEAVDFDQIQSGDKVKASVATEYAIFLVKNGPVPSAGAGVTVAGTAEGTMPPGLVLETKDVTAKVVATDRSYRLLTVKFADETTKTIKVSLPCTLENIQKGDDVVVRTTQGMVMKIKRA